jgi:class 3 adenylate cyclase/predicted ATPase
MDEPSEIEIWLGQLGLAQYFVTFRDNDIDMSIVGDLSDADLKELGLSLGHRRKLLRAINERRASAGGAMPVPPAEAPTTEAPPARGEVEARQLTVLFCDVVTVPALAAGLDAETMKGVLRMFQTACTVAIMRHGGVVARNANRGVVAYFGYPQAQDDDALRAVRSGLALAAVVPQLDTPARLPLQLGIGVATGRVAIKRGIGDDAIDRALAASEAATLAARLQALAEPGTVVVSAETHALVAEQVTLRRLGRQVLDGVREPVEAWATAAPFTPRRFKAERLEGLAHLVGRNEALERLLDCQRLAWSGDGQMVLLSGDAGIGKSRLAAALAEAVAALPHLRLVFQTSRHYRDSALHPIAAQIAQMAGIGSGDPPALRLDKLEALLARETGDVARAAPLLADLLSIPAGGRYPPLGLNPYQQRERLLATLLEQLTAGARRGPVLIIFEDAQWADATTLELLDLLAERISHLPILCVITHRPEFVARWEATRIELGPIEQHHVRAIVEQVTGGKTIPGGLLAAIVARTDGNPLFIEEMTKAVLAPTLLVEEHEGYRLKGPLSPVAIPATLQDALMTRLEDLEAAKAVAQIGAAIGRAFSPALLGRVAEWPEPAVAEALGQLEDADIVRRHGSESEAVYVFKHEMLQDTAYESQLKSRRELVHRRIAEAFRDDFGETAAAHPELVAHHFTEAGLAEAVEWWRKAADRALSRCANVEALRLIDRGLEVVAKAAPGPERQRRQLRLQVVRGAAVLTLRGEAAPEQQAAYERARNLGADRGDAQELYLVLFGLWRNQLAQGALAAAQVTAGELLGIAGRLRDRALHLGAHMALATTCFHLGDFDSAWFHAEAGIELQPSLDARDRESPIFVVGQHPALACLMCTSFILLLRGMPEDALERQSRALALAEEIGMPFQLANAVGWSALWQLMRRDPEAALHSTERLQSLLAAHRSPRWQVDCDLTRGAALVELGETEAGLALLRQGLAPIDDPAFRTLRTRGYTLLTQACVTLGRVDDGHAAIDRALDGLSHRTERWWEAELHRLRGELSQRAPAGAPVPAEASFRTAMAVARSSGLVIFELRAAINLAQLLKGQDRVDEARAPLSGALSACAGGEARDLSEARTILKALSA